MAKVPLGWRLRKRVWTRWQTLRFRLSKPQHIGAPEAHRGTIRSIPMGRKWRKIPLRQVLVYSRLPRDEAKLGMRIFTRLTLLLDRILPQMGKDLPEIDANIDKALKFGLTRGYRKAFRAPVVPAELPPDPDLGELATASPYSVFLARNPDDGFVEWDFRFFGDFEHHRGLRSLAVRVVFSESIDTRKLTAQEIHTADQGVVRRGEPGWREAKRLALCAATTHMSLTRHYGYVHLVSGDHWAVAARNHLPADHPIYRLLWPSLFNSLYTNHAITRGQMLPGGDFEHMFSLTHAGLMACFDTMYGRYPIAVIDPEADWARRGLADAKFDCRSQQNLMELFTLMHDHASRYVDAYYASDEELRADPAVAAFLDALATLIPNGFDGLAGDELTRDGLARLIGAYIYEGNTIHDMAGTSLWDYQLWADRNPTRVYADGRRVPVDVFQRVINNNFALQIKRAPLLADYGEAALDGEGRALFTQFYEECRALQDRYDQAPAGPWRMEPKNLEISMNG